MGSKKYENISFLCFEYDTDVYVEAKNFMLENIVPYKSKYYTYGDYVFYRNSNYIKRYGNESFPNRF